MLELRNLNAHYGGIHAVRGISLKVTAGSLVTLVGANGAGKSTTLRVICGLVRASGGDILFNGSSIRDLRTNEIMRLGVRMVPEGRQIFPDLTVLENLRLGAFARRDSSATVLSDMEKVYELFPRLKERTRQKGGTLSGGEQQMLAIGRALMARPTLLLMDEPSLGLAPILVQEVFRIIRRIHAEGVTVLLIEQNAEAALAVADYGYVLETGTIALEGPGKDLLHDEAVKRAYLGEEVIVDSP